MSCSVWQHPACPCKRPLAEWHVRSASAASREYRQCPVGSPDDWIGLIGEARDTSRRVKAGAGQHSPFVSLVAKGRTEQTGALTPFGWDGRAVHTLPLQSGAHPQWTYRF